jgi:hypothetical protein
MAIGQEPDVQLRPELATNRTPIDFGVEQSAVAQLADSFRKGQVTADDLIERYGTLAKSKEKAQIQGLDEFISPEAIQTRQNQLHAANTQATLQSSPEYQAAQQAQFIDLKNKAEGGDNAAMRQAMIMKGWALPAFDPKTGWTPEARKAHEEAFQDFINYNDTVAAARAFLADAPAKPIVTKKTTIENGQQKTVESTEYVHVNSLGNIVPEKTIEKMTAAAMMTPNMWRHNNRPQFTEISGIKPGKFGGGMEGPLSEPAVTPKAAAPAAAAPTVTPEGEVQKGIVTSTTIEPQKEAPASEVTEKEKLYSQISNADEFAKKLDIARSQIHDAVIKPVGPRYDEGSKISQIANSFGALVGVDASRQKFRTQDELEQFLAQHVQATIRSMAGSGNRVMRAEIENGKEGIGDIIGGHTVSGLFYQAAPKLNSTPETWDRWLNDLDTLFKDARDNAVKGLPVDERNNFPVPARNAPGTSTQAGRPSIGNNPVTAVSTGKKLVFVPGKGYQYVQ